MSDQAVKGLQVYPQAQTATGASRSLRPKAEKRSMQVVGATTAGAGAATVKIQVSNDNTNWIDQSEIALTLSDSETSDGCVSDAAWLYVRANITAISGTGAYVQVYMGEEG